MDKSYFCKICTQKFTRKHNLKRHISVKPEFLSVGYDCYLCKRHFRKYDLYLNHISKYKEGLNFVLFKAAFDVLIRHYRKYLKNSFSLNDIFEEIEDVLFLIQKELLHYLKYKINFNLQAEYILKNEINNTIEIELFNLRSTNFSVPKCFKENT